MIETLNAFTAIAAAMTIVRVEWFSRCFLIELLSIRCRPPRGVCCPVDSEKKAKPPKAIQSNESLIGFGTEAAPAAIASFWSQAMPQAPRTASPTVDPEANEKIRSYRIALAVTLFRLNPRSVSSGA